jgi:hypothetical protein
MSELRLNAILASHDFKATVATATPNVQTGGARGAHACSQGGLARSSRLAITK